MELAIVLAISGLMAGFGVHLLSTHFENKKIELSSQRIVKIDLAIQAFYDFHGYLPCPARLDIAYDDEDAGQSRNCQMSTIKSYTMNGQDVVMGAVPFKELGLAKNYYANLWNNKYIYAVPRNLTKNATKFLEFADEDTNNLFQIKNQKENTILDEKVAYLLVDHGKNDNGSYRKNSAVQNECNIDNCKEDPNFNFLPTRKSNLIWKNYYDLLVKNGKKPDNRTSNIIVDDIWMNRDHPPNSNGIFLLTNAEKYRKLSGNRIKDYSVVQVIYDRDTRKSKYSVINYAKQGSVITRKNDGNFVITVHGLQYVGEATQDFNMQTWEIQNFVYDLPNSDDKDGIYVLYKVKPEHQIEGLESLNNVNIVIKKIGEKAFFVANTMHNQTVFDNQTGELKRYNKSALRWESLDEETSQILVASGDNYCGGRTCKVSGVRKCGPLMPGETDRDIYGRFVVRDFLLEAAANEINQSTTKEVWPDPSKIDHNGLYFSHYALNAHHTRIDPRYPGNNAATPFNSGGAQKFLVKLENNKWYKYQNRDLGVMEEQDVEDLITKYGIRTFEFCKEGVGVFSAYEGMFFRYSSYPYDAPNPMLAVLDGELKVDVYNDLGKPCCEDLDDEKSYIVKYLSHSSLGDNNISCFQKNNFFLYYKNESIGQLNPLLGVSSNKQLNFKVKDDKVNGGRDSNYNGAISFGKTASESEDKKIFKDLINKNGKYSDIIGHLKTNSVISGNEQRFFNLNDDIEEHEIAFDNECKLKFKQKIKRKIKVYNQEINESGVKKDFQMINNINHFYNFSNKTNAEKRMENKVYGYLSDESDKYFGYCYTDTSAGILPHFSQFFFPQMQSLQCNYEDTRDLIADLYDDALNNKNSKINFGEVYYMN